MEGIYSLYLEDITEDKKVETYSFSTFDLEISQMQVGVPLVVWRAALTLSHWLDRHL